MYGIKTLLTKAQLIVLLSFGFCVGALAITAPGTIIFNRAVLSYENAVTEEKILRTSNETSVSVGHMVSFSVENTHELEVDAGVVARFPHRIVNQGNTEDSYGFSYIDLDAEAFDTPVVYLDANRNGEIDPDESAIDQTPLIQAGQAVDIIVTARVSHLLINGQQKNFDFAVLSDKSDKKKSVTNSVTVGEAGVLRIILSTTPSCDATVFPGDIITHRVNAKYSGSRPIGLANYVLDGAVSSGVIFEVPVSENTSYFDFADTENGPVSGTTVLKLEGFADNEWISSTEITDPAFLGSRIISTGFFIESSILQEGELATFSVQHIVKDVSFANEYVLTTVFSDPETYRVSDFVSNSTCNTFSSIEAASRGDLQFMEPISELRDAGQAPQFNADSDFVNAEQYTLKRKDTDPYSTIRDGMYLQLTLENIDHDNIRTDSGGNRYVIATVTSELTGDVVNVVMLETQNPTVFRSIAPIQLSTQVRSEGGTCPVFINAENVSPRYEQENPSCVLQSADNDQLRGKFGNSEAGFILASVAFVHRQSVVFDSRTLLPVSGAVVQVRRVDSGEVEVDSVSGVSYEFVAGANGEFTFPKLEENTEYYLSVSPPVAYSFPSVVPAYLLTDYNVHGFSYGRGGIEGQTLASGLKPTETPVQNSWDSGVFKGVSLNVQDSIDIPLDPKVPERLLAVDKVAAQSIVDIGQSVSYTVTIKNSSAEDLNNVVVEDTVPFGFRYVPGTSLLAGITIANPGRSETGALVFEVGDLAAKQSIVLSYALRASAAAIDGNGINSAIATGVTASRHRAVSIPGKAKVTLRRGGVFSDKAALFGKVYVDQNCDGLQSHKEWPIGGVRLYLQDGSYVVTDADGLFSLYGLNPDQYVIKLDRHTLPKGLELKLLSVEQAADASSRFVELSEGDFHRADFAAGCPKQDVARIFNELKKRNKSIDDSWYLKHAEKLSQLEPSSGDYERSRMSTADGDLSNGVLDGPAGFDSGAITEDFDTRDDDLSVIGGDKLGAARKEKEQMANAKEIVADITKAQAKKGTWLWPRGDMSVNGRFMAVVRAGIEPTLYVNDRAVPASQIGERMVNRREKAQVIAWYGIELDAGENSVAIKGTGPFGNQRVLAEGVFKRPSSGTQIKLSTETPSVPADGGRSVLPMTVNILDENGYPALGVYYITVDSSDGSWVEPDIQDSEPGRQIRVENGTRTLHYKSSGVTGEVRVTVRTGEFSDQLVVHQVAESRPLVVSGFIHAGGYFSTESLGQFSPSTDLGNLDTRGRFESRAALFVKGTVKGKYNLTLSYDSDKQSDRQLLRDINPVLHYPIHGDASIRGFEAQSRSKLYVRVEHDKDSVMWGDFMTDAGSDRRDLARINRTLTGLNSLFENGKNTVRVFAAQEENRNLSEEIPGNGSALLYRLQQYPLVPNSETVELVTRSRENPGLILDTIRLSRLGDYTVDDELGYLSFASAIPTLDSEQNPVYIRVTYDVESDGKDYLVSGVRFDRAVSDRLSFGSSITYDGHATDGKRLVGLYGDYKLGKRTRISVSVANSDSKRQGSGSAHSITIDHQWSQKNAAATTLTRMYADAEFDSTGAATAAGRSETRLQHSQKIKDNTRLLLDVNRSSSSTNGDDRHTVSALVETQITDWQVRAGLRRISQKTDSENEDILTTVLGLRRKFNLLGKSGQANVDYEQDVSQAERRRIAVGAKVNLHKDVTAYSNYEMTNTLLAVGGLSTDHESESFILGVESKVLPSTRLYSEYRMRGGFESRDYETASGVRGDYEISKGLRISPQFEFIKRMGAADTDSIAASLGIVDTRNPNSRRLIRLETRQSHDSDHYGLRASIASRINRDWTAILADNYSRQESTGADPVLRHSFTAAVARRPKYNNKHHMLFMYKLKQEKGVTNGVERTAHVLSTHQNLQVDEGTTLSGRVGLKHDTSRYDQIMVTDFAMLADARLSFDLGRRLNIDTGVGALSTNSFAEVRYSMGMGVNYTLNKNLRLSLGYNLVGFKDEELDAEKYNAEGGRIGLQYKLDEELFQWLK